MTRTIGQGCNVPGGVEFSAADILIASLIFAVLGLLATWVLAAWKAGVRNSSRIEQIGTLLAAFKDEYEKRHEELNRQEERIERRVGAIEQDVKELMRRGNG